MEKICKSIAKDSTFKDKLDVSIQAKINHTEILSLFSYVFINFAAGTRRLYEMMNALNREGDILRRVLSNEDQEDENPTCHCDKYGYFVTDIVDYTKPLTVWNKKVIDPLYHKRL